MKVPGCLHAFGDACGEDPSFEKIKGVLAAGGLVWMPTNIRLVINSLKLEQVIGCRGKKICELAVGSAPATAPAGGAAKIPGAAPATEEKKNEASKEESEDEDLGFGLFE
uniref:60S acidic ribosomal protein P2 n=1 Tax=Ditylenchus dipsaci TaxID=166011 RepID=A0A915DQN5_9BILA